MRVFSITGFVVLIIAVSGCGLKPESPQSSPKSTVTKTESGAVARPVESRWIDLFDGETLFGWRSTSDDVNWSVGEGAITADSGPVGFLMTTVRFRNFELEAECKISDGGNSGIFIGCAETPGDIKTECFEINIAEEHPDGYTTGSIVEHAKTEIDVDHADWFTLNIRTVGDKVTVAVNGEQAAELVTERSTDDDPLLGFIGLQKNKGKVEFRKVRLRPLETTDLFNGDDLAGWHEVPGCESEFSVEDGVIRCVNGPGFLESDNTYGDFVLQFAAKTHAKDLNSGLFFRSMEGTKENPSNGYEVQIHNGYEDGDRTKPANAGTGAIFRRNEVRKVVSDDNEWAYVTLVADGPRFAVWVNGYQVTDWVDERKPDPNPRRGLRLEAGHLILQGHDPTTDVSFKEILVSEWSVE